MYCMAHYPVHRPIALQVLNNWTVITEGFVAVTSSAARVFFAAFYGNLLRPVTALNLVLMCTAFSSFFLVLYRNYEVVQVATMDRFAVGEALALRFVFIRRALSIKWCYYAIVWMLSASHTISIQTEALLLTALDLLKAVFAISAWALYL